MRRRRLESEPALTLRDFERSDLARLTHWIDSPETLFHWTGAALPVPIAARDLESALTEGGRGGRLRQMALAGTAPVGYVELSEIRPEQGSAYVSRAVVEPLRRGQGFGERIVRAVLRRAFEELGLHRVGVRVHETNAAGLVCYRRAGFVNEGRLRDADRLDGRYHDLLVMSVLRQEWGDGSRTVDHRP